MSGPNDDRRRSIPRTDALLAEPRFAAAAERLGRDTVKDVIADAQNRARNAEIAPETVAEVAAMALPWHATSQRRVINATGVVVHTNLGRAPLSPAAIDALNVAAGCTDVEFDLSTGQRARRGRGTAEALAAAVPSAEAVHVVNNGAAALGLTATALAAGREIVVSRGELVEIGDGFRLPDLLTSTGAALREVGTTNRTSRRDYQSAIGPDTGLVLKVHPSNFVMTGFTSSVPVQELAGLGAPLAVDIGSGLLTPDPLLPNEPDAATVLSAGADVVTASADKLLGGPQAGLILGRADVMDRLRRHPLARALRVDKLTLAALEATLRGPTTPTWEALRVPAEALRIRAEGLRDALAGGGVAADACRTTSVVGGGGAPGVELPSWAIALDTALEVPLRTGDTPVAGRVEHGRLLLDLRCVPSTDDNAVHAAIVAAAKER